MNTIPLSLYIHFPWCARKCPYCDFNSHEVTDLPETEYIDALIADLLHSLSFESRRKLTSIFIGGGTPSLISPTAMARLMTFVSDQLDTRDCEVTIEANPGTFDQANFDGYRAAGINRLSIGVQSFSDASLLALGRIHSSNDAIAAMKGARQAGFERINLDLMHGLPRQSVADAMADLDAAFAQSPEHISWYQLTIEPNTVFYSQPPRLPKDSILESVFEQGMRRLNAAGFAQYEVSAFSIPGEQARHNLNYWQFGDYLGIGAGAHGKLTRGTEVVRTTKSRIPADYLRAVKGGHFGQEQTVSRQDLKLEFLMNALRLNAGFSPGLFEARTGLDRSVLDAFIEKATARGLLAIDGDTLYPTRRGHLLLNDLLLLID